MKYILNVKFEDKSQAKKQGAYWCPANKYWYCFHDSPNFIKLKDLYDGYEQGADLYLLEVPFNSKEDAKKHGAVWDVDRKCWTVYASQKSAMYLAKRYNGETCCDLQPEEPPAKESCEIE